MILYGASGHCKVIISTLEGLDIPISVIFDDNKCKIQLKHFHVVHEYDYRILPEDMIIIAIGDNHIRKKISEKIKHPFGSVVSNNAVVENDVCVPEGAVILNSSVIQTGCKLGKHIIINTNSSIDHDCIIEDFVHISPGACVAGGVEIGEGTHVGTNATIIPNIKIGKWVTIGAGTVVIKNIPDFAVVVGNPGKIIKFNHEYEN